MRSARFVSELSSISFDNAFNPYSDRCPVYDRIDAPQRRALALAGMLEAALSRGVDSIWIGRDLGYRGGRRTGLALTDDVHMRAHARRWDVTLERPTKGEPIAERTAAIIWSILDDIDVPIFLWNVFPLHPHESSDPFSNRAHNARERAFGEEVLAEIIVMLCPARIVAIGNDAAKSAQRVAAGNQIIQVRHPSYGGQTDFLLQMRKQYPRRSRTLL
jgi:hypothetical protein